MNCLLELRCFLVFLNLTCFVTFLAEMFLIEIPYFFRSVKLIEALDAVRNYEPETRRYWKIRLTSQ